MIRRSTFHSLRLSMLSRDHAERAPEKARRGLAFSYGTKKWNKMSGAEQQEAFEVFMKHALCEQPVAGGHGYMGAGFDASTEDGLTMAFLPGDGRLARIELSITTRRMTGYMGVIAYTVLDDNPERQAAHMRALMDYGLPFEPRCNWSSVQELIPNCFEQWIIEKSRPLNPGTLRSVWGLADGLYYELSIYDEQLTRVCISDPELVRQAVLLRAQELDESDDRTTKADLSSLQGIMDFVYDSPQQIESSQLGAAGRPVPVQQVEPEVVQPALELSEADQNEIQTLLMNTDIVILPDLMQQMPAFKTVQDFLDARARLLDDPAKQKSIAMNRAELSSSLSGAIKGPATERQVRRAVREAVKGTLDVPFDHKLSGAERLREDLLATDDDLHLIRSALNLSLNINFRSPHWAEVSTISDLEKTAHGLCLHPDPAPREDLPASAIRRMHEHSAKVIASISESFESTARKIRDNFEEDLAHFNLPAGVMG